MQLIPLVVFKKIIFTVWKGRIVVEGYYIFDECIGLCFKIYFFFFVRKFCATTQYNSQKVADLGFIPPYTLEEGLKKTINEEFLK